MKQILFPLISLLTVLLFTLTACEENPIETENELPGRRDYTWTIDTLNVPEGYAIPNLMWGDNSNNLWAIGTAFLNAYQLWFYNGLTWQNYTPDEYIDPRGICGFSANDIWTGSLGTSNIPASFWHYDGTNWKKHSEINIPGYYHITIQSIAGSAPNNIYAVGFADSVSGNSYKGIISHFNGTNWNQINIPDIKSTFIQIFYDKPSGNFIIAGITFETITQYIYKLNNNTIEEIYSTNEGVTLCVIGKNTYAQIGQKLFKYVNNGFVLFKDLGSLNYTGNAWGRSELDFFTINWDGIGHYNGTNLSTIFQKKNNNWFPGGASVFEKDVFFIWDDSYNTFIVHGKLN